MSDNLYGSADIVSSPADRVTRLELYDGPLELAWKHCAMTSDFIADMVALQYRTSPAVYSNVRHSVGYLTNELIENAVKFRASGTIALEASFKSGKFWMKISNYVDRDTASRFQTLLSRITIGEASDLLIEQIEANAVGNDNGSGLGLLTLLSDYDAELAWIFTETGCGERNYIETYALMPIQATENM